MTTDTTTRNRLIIAGATAGVVAAGVVGVVTVQAQDHAAAKENQRVSVAVVDRNGNVIVTLRGDGAGPQSYDAAQQKAFTAVSWNAPTTELAKRLESAPHLADIDGTLFLGSGAPVKSNNAPIAGIGVAGAPSGDLDQKFAQAGVASLGS
ncbi:GlcG/HbpS family heme-binding protein [Nocardia fluminea]|uniref:GlcG/HbpS family heme-binding protein n=1 Tax=Nocardia fluminea TaxID=134984 RepID=UPI003D0A6A24